MKKQKNTSKNNLTKRQNWRTVKNYSVQSDINFHISRKKTHTFYILDSSYFYAFGRLTYLLTSRLKYLGKSSSYIYRIKPKAKLAWCLHPFTKAS